MNARLVLSLLAIIAFTTSAQAKDIETGVFPEVDTKHLRFDVMDVSYLWPEYTTNLLSAVDVANRELDLLPSRDVFTKFQAFTDIESGLTVQNPLSGKFEPTGTRTDTITKHPLSSYRVVSFRVDDCGPLSRHHQSPTFEAWSIGTGGKTLTQEKKNCVPQLRLILQPDYFWEDVALHFIYSFVERPDSFELDFKSNLHKPNERILNAMLSDLLYLKSVSPYATDKMPLGPHVGLQTGPKQRDFEAKVLKFLRHYAQKEYLTEIATISSLSFDGDDEWIFASLNINHQSPDNLELNPILSLKDSNLTQAFTIDKLDSLQGAEYERPETSLLALGESDIRKILQISDPRKTTQAAVDCTSCHSETRSLLHLANTDQKRLAKIGSSGAEVMVKQGITGFPNPFFLPNKNELSGHFRSFGFFLNSPTVNFRVAFESAHVAASANLRLFGSEVGNGLTCTKRPLDLLNCSLFNANKANDCFTSKKYCE